MKLEVVNVDGGNETKDFNDTSRNNELRHSQSLKAQITEITNYGEVYIYFTKIIVVP